MNPFANEPAPFLSDQGAKAKQESWHDGSASSLDVGVGKRESKPVRLDKKAWSGETLPENAGTRTKELEFGFTTRSASSFNRPGNGPTSLFTRSGSRAMRKEEVAQPVLCGPASPISSEDEESWERFGSAF